MSDKVIKVLQKTEVIDGTRWRLLPKAVVEDGGGRYWIPESYVKDAALEGTDK